MQLPLFLPESDWVPPTELPDLRRMPEIAWDTEAKDDGLAAGRGPGWVYRAGHIAGVSAAWREGSAARSIYVPLRHPDTDNLPPDNVRRWVADHLAVQTTRHIFHNGPYDLGWFRAEWGIKPPALIDDTTAMAVMIDENMLSYKLDPLMKRHGLQGKDEILLREAMAAYGYTGSEVKANLWRVPARYVGPYGEGDAVGPLELVRIMRPMLEEQELVEAYDTEMELIPIIQEMKLRGIRVDVDGAHRAMDNLRQERDKVLAEVARTVGRTSLRIEDVRKVANLEHWHTEAGISYPRTPKTQVGSFSADWMRKSEHALPRLVSRATQLEDAASKFIEGFIIDYAHKGRLHADINQFRSDEGGARTHRFSYANPALQQMPGDKQPELKEIIRGLFLPEEGEVWGALDYSQQEYRLIVHFAVRMRMPGAEEAAARYRDDAATDFHQLVADMTGLPRRNAKDVNFAKVYGAGLSQFCLMTGMEREDGERVMTKYDELLPFPKALNDLCTNRAGARGYIRMIDGARMHFDRWEPKWRGDAVYSAPAPLDAARLKWPGIRLKRAFVHKAMNALIQGSAARQTKKAIVACWKEGYVPLIQLHDELDFSVSNKREVEILSEIMRTIVPLEVPMMVDAEVGPSWGKAKNAYKTYEDLPETSAGSTRVTSKVHL